MGSVYLYAVSYDLGFAPNPFGGLCSLACCKPAIRASAEVGDWVVGLTGTKVPPALRCVFAMQVTRELTFDQYWSDPEFRSRKPQRNGSLKKQVGDNIYHRLTEDDGWIQENSVHSLDDGSQCNQNTTHDTRVNRVLLSDRFIYFGESAREVPKVILEAMGYQKNPRDRRRYDANAAEGLLAWLKPQIARQPNMILGDPIDFDAASKRYSARLKRMV